MFWRCGKGTCLSLTWINQRVFAPRLVYFVAHINHRAIVLPPLIVNCFVEELKRFIVALQQHGDKGTHQDNCFVSSSVSQTKPFLYSVDVILFCLVDSYSVIRTSAVFATNRLSCSLLRLHLIRKSGDGSNIGKYFHYDINGNIWL